MDDTPWVVTGQHLVHRKAADSVLIEAHRKTAEREVEFALGRPGVIGHFRQTGNTVDSLLLAEYLRQSTIAYGHLAWGVPLGWAFIMGRMEFSIERVLPVGALGAHVAPLFPKLSHGSLRAVTSDVTFHSEGKVFARGRGELSVVSAELYSRLRGEVARTSQTGPDSFGGEAVCLEAVAKSLTEWHIQFDPTCTFFFDHEVDHVPGMLLFSAVRNACVRAAGPTASDVRLFDGQFFRFAELGEPLRVRVVPLRPGGNTFTTVVLDDDDSVVLAARVVVVE